jgi:hypothetical protein
MTLFSDMARSMLGLFLIDKTIRFPSSLSLKDSPPLPRCTSCTSALARPLASRLAFVSDSVSISEATAAVAESPASVALHLEDARQLAVRIFWTDPSRASQRTRQRERVRSISTMIA